MSMINDIIVVDDHIPNLRFLTELLEQEGYNVRQANKAKTALESAVARPPGLILLDVRLPDMDGYELCNHLKQDKRTAHVPVILLVRSRTPKPRKEVSRQEGEIIFQSHSKNLRFWHG